MEGYRRMGIDVGRLIDLVRDFSPIWDPSDEAYKDCYYRDHCWTKVLRQLYPDWDSCNNTTQLQIEKDVKQRWRSVKDRFHKYVASCNKSGSSPTRHSFPFYEELQFLVTGRILRSTQGNIVPPAEEDSEEASGRSTGAPATCSSAGEDGFGGGPLSADAGASSSTAAENCVVVETVGRGTAGGPVSGEPKQTKKKEDKTIKAANETLALIKKKSTTEDKFYFFALQITSKARSLPPDRQNIFTSMVQMSLTALHDPTPILPYDDILMSVFGLFRKKTQGQPQNQQYQASRPYTSELLGPPNNQTYNQDAATNYGYYPQYHNLN
ncbi:uncharacterized protein [Dendrobates tinctorius]|uniref:uncharacterized protein n=1 Tax=Dendrobates tinctorius TaxID=92724 RepID=UPI003CC9C9B7